MKQKDFNGRRYQPEEMGKANRLLRLELSLRRHWFRDFIHWSHATAEILTTAWHVFFDRIIGAGKVVNDKQLLEACIDAGPTPGQGKSAYSTWCLIKSEGWERAKDMTSERTWYRNLKILRAAGLGDADLSKGQIIQFRQKPIIEYQVINNWRELLKAA